jgi:ABC-type antimicrobial peptide transport system permease subunit
MLLAGFAVLALVLASLGVYSVMANLVAHRTSEIGIRMALGASARDVQAGILGSTLRLATFGVVIGAAVSWLLARGAAALLFGVTPRDPGTFAAMAAALVAVALVAGYLPARRATRIDPMVALRAE